MSSEVLRQTSVRSTKYIISEASYSHELYRAASLLFPPFVRPLVSTPKADEGGLSVRGPKNGTGAMDMWINSSHRWLLEFFVDGRDKDKSHGRRIRPGGGYYDNLAVGGPVFARTLEFLKPGATRTVPNKSDEYQVFFEPDFNSATLVRGGDGDPRETNVSLRP